MTRPQVDSQPVRWWRLICEVEELSDRTGLGFAGVWGHIHRGEYGQALGRLAVARQYLEPVQQNAAPSRCS